MNREFQQTMKKSVLLAKTRMISVLLSIKQSIDGYFLGNITGIKKIQRIKSNSYHGLARLIIFLILEVPSGGQPWYLNWITGFLYIFRLYLLRMKKLEAHDLLCAMCLIIYPLASFSSDEKLLIGSVFPLAISIVLYFFMVPRRYATLIYFVNTCYIFRFKKAALDVFNSENDALKTVMVRNLYDWIIPFMVAQFLAFNFCRMQFDGILRDQKKLVKDLTAINIELTESNKKHEQALKLLEATNKQLELSKKHLEEALKTKDILATVSHELRNPLNSLLGNIELLLDEVTDKDQRQKLQVAKICGDVLLCLINNLLDAAKISSDKIEVSLIPVNMYQFLEKVWRINSGIINKKNLSGQFYVSKNFPKYLMADPQRILQILMNLISNAVKFTDKGFVKIVFSWVSGIDLTRLKSLSNPSDVSTSPISSGQVRNHSERKTLEKSCLSQISQSSNSQVIDYKARLLTSFHKFAEKSDVIDDDESSNRVNSVNRTNSPIPKFLKDVLPETYHFFHSESLNISENLEKTTLSARLLQSLCNPKNGLIKIEVIDSGCGIATEAQDKLFTPFTQEDATITRKYGGTGLGLYIIKNLIHKMKGEISFTSYKNVGPTFVAHIPSEITDDRMEEQQLQIQRVDTLNNDYSGCVAMVVEDNSYNQNILKSFLQKFGIKHHVCDNGKQAYDLYKSMPLGYFSFITMDLQMPVMDGINACRSIREFEESVKIANPVPIVIVTGNCSELEKDTCINPMGQIRASFFFRKPLKIADCSHFISVIMNKMSNSDNQPMEIRMRKNLHFLVVDDDQLSLSLLCQHLLKNNIDFDIATNGLEAFEKVKAAWSQYDGVLMDCEMPVMDGIEATERIKTFLRKQNRKDIRIYGLTGHTDAEHNLRFKEAGMHRAFHKPINFADLVSYLVENHKL